MKKVAVIADVHGNAPALAAVLAEIEREQPDLIVSCGDLTWGPLPEETYELARGLNARFVRGNADRAVLEGVSETEREQWMQAHHTEAMREFLGTFEENVVVEVDGLGAVRFCHGSPRSDEECVTPETPEERVREFSAGVDETVIVSAHVHIQFDREVGRHPQRERGQRRPSVRGHARARTGRSSGRTWSCAAPSTTSTRPSSAIGRAASRTSSRSSR